MTNRKDLLDEALLRLPFSFSLFFTHTRSTFSWIRFDFHLLVSFLLFCLFINHLPRLHISGCLKARKVGGAYRNKSPRWKWSIANSTNTYQQDERELLSCPWCQSPWAWYVLVIIPCVLIQGSYYWPLVLFWSPVLAVSHPEISRCCSAPIKLS